MNKIQKTPTGRKKKMKNQTKKGNQQFKTLFPLSHFPIHYLNLAVSGMLLHPETLSLSFVSSLSSFNCKGCFALSLSLRRSTYATKGFLSECGTRQSAFWTMEIKYIKKKMWDCSTQFCCVCSYGRVT